MKDNRFDWGQEALVDRAQSALVGLSEQIAEAFRLLGERHDHGDLDEAASFAVEVLQLVGDYDHDATDLSWELYLLCKKEVSLPLLRDIG